MEFSKTVSMYLRHPNPDYGEPERLRIGKDGWACFEALVASVQGHRSYKASKQFGLVTKEHFYTLCRSSDKSRFQLLESSDGAILAMRCVQGHSFDVDPDILMMRVRDDPALKTKIKVLMHTTSREALKGILETGYLMPGGPNQTRE